MAVSNGEDGYSRVGKVFMFAAVSNLITFL